MLFIKTGIDIYGGWKNTRQGAGLFCVGFSAPRGYVIYMFVLVEHDACPTACLVSDAVKPHFLGEVRGYKIPLVLLEIIGHGAVVLLVCGVVRAA